MTRYSNYEKLVNLFSNKKSLKIIEVFPTTCFILILVTPIKKLEKLSEEHILKSISEKLKKFTGFEFILLTDYHKYISVIGNCVNNNCKKTDLSLEFLKRKRRKR